MIRNITAFAFVLLATSALALASDEKKIALNDAPAPVQAAAKKAAGDAKITSVSKETEHGKTVYEVEFTVAGIEHSTAFAEDGKLLEDEVEIEASDLPKAVSDTVAKEVPGGKIKEAAKVTADGKTFYEVDVKVGDVEHELKVQIDGKLISKEIEKDEKDGKEDEKQK